MLTPEQIMLVQSSWDDVEPMMDKLGEAFYHKLFSLNPEIKELFENDIRRQGSTLMSMISMAVEMLDHPDGMQAAMGSLGQRHTGYGVQQRHFAPFQEALMWALEKVLGQSFSGDLRSAWEAMFALMTRLMQGR